MRHTHRLFADRTSAATMRAKPAEAVLLIARLYPVANASTPRSQRHRTGQGSMRHDTSETAQARCTRESPCETSGSRPHRAIPTPICSPRCAIGCAPLRSDHSFQSSPAASESPGRTRTGWVFTQSRCLRSFSSKITTQPLHLAHPKTTHRQRFDKCGASTLQLTRFNHPRQLGDTCGLRLLQGKTNSRAKKE